MRTALLALGLVTLGLGWCPASAQAQDRVDPRLAAVIQRIRPIDNHCHDDPVTPDRGRTWSPAAPLGAPDYPDVEPLRRDNPAWIAAWRALYGYRYSDMKPAHLRELLATKQRLMRRLGEAWPVWVLDKAGVDIAVVNETHLGRGQQGGRFRWAPYADPMLWPFDGKRSRLAYSGGPSSIDQLLEEAGSPTLPKTLESYEELVGQTLSRWKMEGAVAVKFLAGYTRGLDFGIVDREQARNIYAKGASGSVLSPVESKVLEDYLFGAVVAQAGRTGLAVHIHTGNGNGPYFDNHRVDPSLLEPAIDSQAARRTTFVLLHGGWPYYRTAQAMMDKPNTYADFSAQTFYLTPHALAEVLRGWLEWHPEKVLFGTDAYSDANTPLSDYEEKEWLLTHNAKRALGIALTDMMRDREISFSRAVEIARMVLRENAIRLYGLTDKGPISRAP